MKKTDQEAIEEFLKNSNIDEELEDVDRGIIDTDEDYYKDDEDDEFL